MYPNWYIVQKSFNSGSELLTPGNPVNAELWRNARSLKEAGYIKEPQGEEEIEKIRQANEAANHQERQVINKSLDEPIIKESLKDSKSNIRRGQKPKRKR